MIYNWQSRPWQQLRQQAQAQRLPHALLFTGASGLGKLDFALALASGLLCRQPQASGEACGQCDACHLLQAPHAEEADDKASAVTHVGTHPDCLWLAPPEADKAIRVDDIRELCSKLALTSQYGGYKLAIIDQADSMNVNAANSLLKTLEEPGANSVLILVSSRPQRLPVTIRSRCQRVTFHAPDAQQAVAWLREQQVEQPELLLSLAHGAPLRARQLASTDALAPRQQLISALLGAAGHASLVAQAELLAKWPAQELLGWLHDWLADVLRLQSVPEAGIIHADQRKELQRFAVSINSQSLFGLLDEVLNLRRMQTVSLNPQLLWEDLLISWQLLLKRA